LDNKVQLRVPSPGLIGSHIQYSCGKHSKAVFVQNFSCIPPWISKTLLTTVLLTASLWQC